MTVGRAYPLAGLVRVPILSCEVSLCDAAPEIKQINTVDKLSLYAKSKHYPQKVDKTNMLHNWKKRQKSLLQAHDSSIG